MTVPCFLESATIKFTTLSLLPLARILYSLSICLFHRLKNKVGISSISYK